MTPKKIKEKKDRVKKMWYVLHKLYPDSKIELNYSSTWELLVAVILSAQCTDERVNKVTEKLFKKYKKVGDYAKARQAIFERDVYQAGFYRNKAKNIIASAKIIRDKFDGKVPDTMDELLSLPGVARKTANIILSHAFGKNEGIAVDTHVRRFVIRFDLSDYKDPVRIERDLMEIVLRKHWKDFNHNLVLYGRYICKARKHDCKDHPLTKVYPRAAKVWPKAK